MEIDIKNIGVVQQLRNSKEVSDELKEQAINYIETLQTLVNQLSLHDVMICRGCGSKDTYKCKITNVIVCKECGYQD
jgi:hypothetical protein